jgi:acyl-CoA oxidase
MTKEDILSWNSKAWDIHSDPIMALDGSVGTFMSIHWTLCAGTLAVLGSGRDDIESLIKDVLDFNIS